MKHPSSGDPVDALLPNVSRSFYLTLRVLPSSLRGPIGLAYLLARAADTMADSPLVAPERRLEWLLWWRGRVNGQGDGDAPLRGNELALSSTSPSQDPHELALLHSLSSLSHGLEQTEASDRDAVRGVVTTLTIGMEFDLRTFPDERSGTVAALATLADLDRYTYLIAGCVGEFWTSMSCAHVHALRNWDVAEMSRAGVRFGKALQLTNILRDCAKDLRIGRCYLPLELLAMAGLQPTDLLNPGNAVRARPVLAELTRLALDHYREAARYALALPRQCLRLRLACLWPILIGLRTLALHARNPAWLDPGRPSKVTRASVYRMMAASMLAVHSNTLIRRWIECEVLGVERALRPVSSSCDH